jgi:hypothetical protein
MHRHLRVQRMPKQTARAVVEGHARFVAGSLNAQYQHRTSIACGFPRDGSKARQRGAFVLVEKEAGTLLARSLSE